MPRTAFAVAFALLVSWTASGGADPIIPGPEAFEGTAKNIILFVGDGMGVSTVTAARMYSGGADAELTLDRLPFTALSRTYSASHLVTDSAAGMNALITGQKTANGAISVDETGAPLRTLLEMAEAAGKSTGVVTTTTVTHATPGACYAHVGSRRQESAVAAQIVPGSATYNAALGDGLEVILGGGRQFFVPRATADGTPVIDEEQAPGQRTDARDLRTEMQAVGYTYIWNASQLAAVDPTKTDRLLGLFEPSHLRFEVERQPGNDAEPTLAAMTAAAIAILQKNPQGYFLLVEGGRIDHAHHGNNAYAALTETLMFDQALATAIAKVDLQETLIVATADHSHVLTISGYAERGTSVLGLAGEDATGVPYTTLGYMNGPGFRGAVPRVAPAEDPFPGAMGGPAPQDPTHPTYLQESGIPIVSETHGGEDVIVWAAGRRAGQVRGMVENTRVFTWLKTAAGL